MPSKLKCLESYKKVVFIPEITKQSSSPFLYRFGKKDPAYHEFTFGKSYIYLCSTLTMRGWSILPSKTAAKIALFSLLFFGTLMFWHWEAMLISYLATRVNVMPFTDIADLVANTGIFSEAFFMFGQCLVPFPN